jgi:hypothetical protein
LAQITQNLAVDERVGDAQDEMAVDAVSIELVSGTIPVIRENYREIYPSCRRVMQDSPLMTALLDHLARSVSIQNRETNETYQGIVCTIRIPIRDQYGPPRLDSWGFW